MIFFIGPRGSGKSTVGAFTAHELRCTHIDLDIEIISSTGKSIAQIVEDEGWERFRKLETQTLYDILKKYANAPRFNSQGNPVVRAVISTGGGVPLSPINCKLMRESGFVVYLDAPADLLIERLSNDNREEMRPPLTEKNLKEEIECILSERCAIYNACSHIKLKASRTPEDLATDAIYQARMYFIENNPRF